MFVFRTSVMDKHSVKYAVDKWKAPSYTISLVLIWCFSWYILYLCLNNQLKIEKIKIYLKL